MPGWMGPWAAWAGTEWGGWWPCLWRGGVGASSSSRSLPAQPFCVILLPPEVLCWAVCVSVPVGSALLGPSLCSAVLLQAWEPGAAGALWVVQCGPWPRLAPLGLAAGSEMGDESMGAPRLPHSSASTLFLFLTFAPHSVHCTRIPQREQLWSRCGRAEAVGLRIPPQWFSSV